MIKTRELWTVVFDKTMDTERLLFSHLLLCKKLPKCGLDNQHLLSS